MLVSIQFFQVALMSMTDPLIVLRIPRSEGATELSAALVDRGVTTVVRAASIPAIGEMLAAKLVDSVSAQLVFPLDGRFLLSHMVLAETEKRGWSFSRHVPAGSEMLLLDVEGADSGPELSPDAAANTLEARATEIQDAIDRSELGEALGVSRHAMTTCLRHLGPFHEDSLWVISNWIQLASATGSVDNIGESVRLLCELLDTPIPTTLSNPTGTLRKLNELAHRCAEAERTDVSRWLLEKSVAVARNSCGDNHIDTLGTQNNLCLFLSAHKDPSAEQAMRELLRNARTVLGDGHANLAVIMMNLAELLENLGQTAEVTTLRAEAAAIRGA
jgi:hypothetical protein